METHLSTRLGLPPEEDGTVVVPRYPSPALEGRAPDGAIFAGWEWALLSAMFPSHRRFYLNARAKDGPLYLRFAEQLPDGRAARHDVARYLEAARAYWCHRLDTGAKPPWRGPPIKSVNGDPLDQRPQNR